MTHIDTDRSTDHDSPSEIGRDRDRGQSNNSKLSSRGDREIGV
jgi:hypothetical protein